jgi:hypothetical protein
MRGSGESAAAVQLLLFFLFVSRGAPGRARRRAARDMSRRVAASPGRMQRLLRRSRRHHRPVLPPLARALVGEPLDDGGTPWQRWTSSARYCLACGCIWLKDAHGASPAPGLVAPLANTERRSVRAEEVEVGTGYYEAVLRACQVLAETDEDSTAKDSEKARDEFEARLLWRPAAGNRASSAEVSASGKGRARLGVGLGGSSRSSTAASSAPQDGQLGTAATSPQVSQVTSAIAGRPREKAVEGGEKRVAHRGSSPRAPRAPRAPSARARECPLPPRGARA